MFSAIVGHGGTPHWFPPCQLLEWQRFFTVLAEFFQDALDSANIVLVTETHENSTRPLPSMFGSQWLSTFRNEVCFGGVRDSWGVACLVSKCLFSWTFVAHSNNFARFMWVQISWRTSHLRDIDIVVC